MDPGSAYQLRLAQERRFYQGREEIHELPGIFHYWSEKYVRPKLRAIGFEGSLEFIIDPLRSQCERNPARVTKFLSLGSGNCDLEIQIASKLLESGVSGFRIECLDLNDTMLERGRAAARARGVAGSLIFTAADLNLWKPAEMYDAVIAIQALHHVVELEHLFRSVKEGLTELGSFVVSDMIGRNGHMRWPEALSIVQEFWRRLPPSHRYNHQLLRYEERFEDWDCSTEGFEGIRSQDILPLLIENFHFTHFLAFANVVDPFVERSFGPNFDPSIEWDRTFIDDLHRRDEEEMRAGRIAPTHMFAILANNGGAPMSFIEPFTPSFCVRRGCPDPGGAIDPTAGPDAYDWDSFPVGDRRALQVACARLAAADKRIRSLTEELRTTTDWGLEKDRDLRARTAWALHLDREIDELTSHAVRLEAERTEALALAQHRELEFQERTAWALALERELQILRRSLEERVSMRRCIHDLLQGIVFRLRRAVSFRSGRDRVL
jgi:SAM-dependent methyltransferase